MTDIFEQLAAPFPEEKIHWRAQQLSRDGSKAMALAYVDARDVMNRLDEVCGPDGWQCEHYDAGGGKLGCRIAVRIHLAIKGGEMREEWVWKSDGAGDTQVEAEKGAFSSALKRAAVAWGVGRYLYDMSAPWVPCETYEGRDGKKRFSKWKENPWSYAKGIKGGVRPGDESGADAYARKQQADIPRNEQEWKEWGAKSFAPVINGCKTVAALDKVMKEFDERLKALKHASANYHKHLVGIADAKRSDLEKTELTLLDAG